MPRSKGSDRGGIGRKGEHTVHIVRKDKTVQTRQRNLRFDAFFRNVYTCPMSIFVSQRGENSAIY